MRPISKVYIDKMLEALKSPAAFPIFKTNDTVLVIPSRLPLGRQDAPGSLAGNVRHIIVSSGSVNLTVLPRGLEIDAGV